MVKHYIMAGLVLASVATCPALSWADFVAKVVTVHDGDRLTIRHDGYNETIHIKDIDCPELKQPHGKQAKHATSAYVGNRDVVVRGLIRDKQGRVSAEVLLQDGRNVGHELLKEGLAWWKKSSSGDRSLETLEELARASRKGLWADPNPVPPWKWKAPKRAGLKYSN
jgi:endonuclease YncB( thermonuclease family)